MTVCEFFRHELPVKAAPIEILADTSDLLVVNKPSTIPIHPCGRYRFNCLLYILAKEKGLRNLRGKLLGTFTRLLLIVYIIYADYAIVL